METESSYANSLAKSYLVKLAVLRDLEEEGEGSRLKLNECLEPEETVQENSGEKFPCLMTSLQTGVYSDLVMCEGNFCFRYQGCFTLLVWTGSWP